MAETTSESLTNDSQNLPRQPFYSTVITGTGVPGGLSDYEFKPSTSPVSSEEFDYRGVQGVLVSGGSTISEQL